MDNNTLNEVHSTNHTPIWIRLPRQGTRCSYTGLSRAVMHRLVAPCKENDHSPQVQSKLLLQEGKSRGVRLVNFESLISYLASFGEVAS
jgi:hypothetical protein